MATKRDAHNTANEFPHIAIRSVEGMPEAYLPGTGLSVWEIAWLGRAYSGAAHAIAEHTGAGPDLVEEGLRYAAEYCQEIDEEIVRHTERPLEDLLEMFPGMRVVSIEPDDSDRRH